MVLLYQGGYSCLYQDTAVIRHIGTNAQASFATEPATRASSRLVKGSLGRQEALPGQIGPVLPKPYGQNRGVPGRESGLSASSLTHSPDGCNYDVGAPTSTAMYQVRLTGCHLPAQIRRQCAQGTGGVKRQKKEESRPSLPCCHLSANQTAGCSFSGSGPGQRESGHRAGDGKDGWPFVPRGGSRPPCLYHWPMLAGKPGQSPVRSGRCDSQ